MTGRVQGVGFRYYVYRKALELQVKGWVRNLADGRVECWAEADARALDIFEHHVRTGPSLARVKYMEVETQKLRGYSTFLMEV